MKNLILLLCCCSASIIMSSCTAEILETENPVIHADDSTNPPPIGVPPGIDHGGDSKDKDKGDN